jgi:hypothetical protein
VGEIRGCVLRQLNSWLPYGLAYAATEQIEAWIAELRRRGKAKATLRIYPYHVVTHLTILFTDC